MARLAKIATVAVFVAPSWTDQARLRLWAKSIGEVTCGESKVELVLLTDDLTDGNAVIMRQLRCSGVVSAVVRMAGTLRSQVALQIERERRDLTMARAADVVFDFGDLNRQRFPGIETVSCL